MPFTQGTANKVSHPYHITRLFQLQEIEDNKVMEMEKAGAPVIWRTRFIFASVQTTAVLVPSRRRKIVFFGKLVVVLVVCWTIVVHP